MNSRYYSASTGQFTTRDTYLGNISNPATHNLYTYTGNNPINFVDPTGHRAMTVENTYGKYSYWDPMDCFANPEPIAIVPNTNVKVNQGLEIKKDINPKTIVSNPFFTVKQGLYNFVGNNITEGISLDFNYSILAGSYDRFEDSTGSGVTASIKIGSTTHMFSLAYNSNDEWMFTNAVCKSNYFCANSYAVGQQGRYFSFTNYSGINIENGIQTQQALYTQTDIHNQNIVPVAVYVLPLLPASASIGGAVTAATASTAAIAARAAAAAAAAAAWINNLTRIPARAY